VSAALKVLVYNRSLPTLGGGERYSLALASCLARQHQVTVVSREPVDRHLAAARLDVDLDRIRFMAVPSGLDSLISDLSATSDVFVNASHNDFTPSRARLGALLVYFPARPHLDPVVTRLHRALKLAARQALAFPIFQAGVFRVDAEAGGLRRTTAGHVVIRLPASQRAYTAHLELAALDPKVRQASLAVGARRAVGVDLRADGVPVAADVAVLPGDATTSGVPLILDALGQLVDPLAPLLAIRGPACDLAGDRLYRALFERGRPAWGLSLQYVPPVQPPILPAVNTYRAVWTSSCFSQKWINRYWRRESALLYPPVDTGRLAPRTKKNQILSVGRFFSGQHNKKHRFMISAFSQMVDEGLSGWELHLAGGSMAGDAHERYLAGLRELAQGYPILIHSDLSAEGLAQLYGESAIYWHATGYGEDEERHPERLEHFGISTVEAMAAGCVPVVIGKGGQPEIVQHERNGMLWQTMDEIKALTWRLVREADLRQAMAIAAREDCQRFGQARFESEIGVLLSQIGVD
jgi:glycosyltransferase involved in cell wall biosynthesis